MNRDRVQRASLVGSVVTAFMASICCTGPLVFAAIGLCGTAFIQTFDAYRLPFMVGTGALLGTACYFTYKRPAKCTDGAQCADLMPSMTSKVIFWLATASAVFLVFFPAIERLF